MVVNKAFKMKNYTTDISAERSILEIEKLLTLFGAETVIKKYTTEGRVDSLMFQLQEEAKRLLTIVRMDSTGDTRARVRHSLLWLFSWNIYQKHKLFRIISNSNGM